MSSSSVLCSEPSYSSLSTPKPFPLISLPTSYYTRVVSGVAHLGLLSVVLLLHWRCNGAHTAFLCPLPPCTLQFAAPPTGSIILASSLSPYYTGVVSGVDHLGLLSRPLHWRYHGASTAFSSSVHCLCASTATSSPTVSLAVPPTGSLVHDSMLVMSDTAPRPLSTAVAMVRRTLHFFSPFLC